MNHLTYAYFDMMKESLYLATTIGTGGFLAWSIAERLANHFLHTERTNLVTLSSLWLHIPTLVLFIYTRRQYSYISKMRVNGCAPAPIYPHKDPILGTDWIKLLSGAIKQHKILQVWDDLFKTIGDTYWYQNAGVSHLMTNEPENVKAMLSTNFDDWPILSARQMTTILSMGPHSIFSVNGKEWHDGRHMIRPCFVRNQVADLECQDRHVERFLAKIPKDGSKINMQDLFWLLTMDSATDFMLGYSTNMLHSPNPEALEFGKAFDFALRTAGNRGRMGRLAFLKPNKELDQARATCKNFIDRYMAEALADEKTKERPYVFLNEIVNAGVSPEHVRDQLLSIIVGGRDTSAATMSCLLWELARHPNVVKKLRAEIFTLDGVKPTWENLKEFRYLSMVLKEVLRMYPPVSTNSRTAAKDTILPRGGGANGKSPVFVPKGTTARWSSHSLHNRKDFYGDDADQFRPERWETLRPTWEYVPFSGGPRICIGQQFALTQMSYVIVRLFQTFKTVEPRDDRPMLQQVGTTTSLANGCWVSFKAL